jgi:hypothetical protein
MKSQSPPTNIPVATNRATSAASYDVSLVSACHKETLYTEKISNLAFHEYTSLSNQICMRRELSF